MKKDKKLPSDYKEQEIEFLVKAVAFHTSFYGDLFPDYPKERKLLGYIPMIFGQSWFGGQSVLIPAVDGLDIAWRDPTEKDVYGTAEEAMEAWEVASPMEVPVAMIGRNKLLQSTVKKINELGLYRSRW